MSPTGEAAYLRSIADEIAIDTRYGPVARLVAGAILTARADRLTRKDHT